MPKLAKELSALEVKRRARKPGFHFVGGVSGLALNVKDRDSRAASWILRKRIADRRVDIGLGGYPTITLEQARERARKALDDIDAGTHPLDAKRAARDAVRAADDALRAAEAKRKTFDEAAIAAHRAKSPEFKNAKHSAQWINTLRTYASPHIGAMAVGDIGLPDIVSVLQPIWLEKPETATRVRQRLEAVLAWATVAGYRSGDNPARWSGNLQHVLAASTKIKNRKHHATVPWKDIGTFMASLRERDGIAARAVEFAVLCAARSGEVRGATWDEIDLDAALWTIPAKRMKAGKRHTVPLSAPAVALLRALPRFDGVRYVFAAPRGGTLSDMALTSVLRRMKVDATVHGSARSAFKDWARSATRYADEVTELALAHVNSDSTRAAYARDELLPKRKLLMRDWAKYLGSVPVKRSANVTSIGAAAHAV